MNITGFTWNHQFRLRTFWFLRVCPILRIVCLCIGKWRVNARTCVCVHKPKHSWLMSAHGHSFEMYYNEQDWEWLSTRFNITDRGLSYGLAIWQQNVGWPSLILTQHHGCRGGVIWGGWSMCSTHTHTHKAFCAWLPNDNITVSQESMSWFYCWLKIYMRKICLFFIYFFIRWWKIKISMYLLLKPCRWRNHNHNTSWAVVCVN